MSECIEKFGGALSIKTIPIAAYDSGGIIADSARYHNSNIVGVRIIGKTTIDAIAGYDFWKPQDVTELKIKAMIGYPYKSNLQFK